MNIPTAVFPWGTTNDILVDGTYALIYTETLGNGNDVYSAPISGDAHTRFYLNEANCLADDPAGGIGNLWKVVFYVEIDPVTQEVVGVQSEGHFVNTGGGPQPPFEDVYLLVWSGTESIGGGNSNQHTCSSAVRVPQSESGTWLVEYA